MSKIETATRYKCDGCGQEAFNPMAWSSFVPLTAHHYQLVVGAGIQGGGQDYCPDCCRIMKLALNERRMVEV